MNRNQVLDPSTIVEVVARHFCCEPADVFRKYRNTRVSDARIFSHAFVCSCRDDMTISAVAVFFKRDWAAISNSRRRAIDLIRTERSMFWKVLAIADELAGL